MKWRSTRGTVINIPDGLTPKQIAAIKADANAGYGTRAQQTADDLAKKLKATPPPPPAAPVAPAASPAPTPVVTPAAPVVPQATTPTNVPAVITPAPEPTPQTPAAAAAAGATGPASVSEEPTKEEGKIDPVAAAEEQRKKREEDAALQFKLDHPDETDQYGNTITYSRGPNGEVIRTVKQGDTAKTFTEAAMAAARSFNGEADRKRAEEATYGTLTKYYDRDMARDLEAQKQELAERGIPYDPAAAQDPNSKNLYGRTIGGINERYRGLKDDASRQAVVAGNQAYATTSAARDSFLSAVTAGANTFGADYGNYVNTIRSQLGDDNLSILSMTAQQYATLKGISVQEAQSLRDEALRKQELVERERASRASEDLAARELTLAEENAAVEQEIARLGLSQSAADSLRNDATAREQIKQRAREAKAGNRTAIQIAQIGKSGSGGGGKSSDSGGGYELPG